jgi:hypothetical protein
MWVHAREASENFKKRVCIIFAKAYLKESKQQPFENNNRLTPIIGASDFRTGFMRKRIKNEI